MTRLFLLGPGWPARLAAFALLGLGAAGCAQPMERPAYLAYLIDPIHGLTHTQEAGGTTVTCSYRPADLLVSQELATEEAAVSSTTVDSLRHTYAGKLYCTLALSRDSAELETSFIRDETARGQAISYLSEGIAHDVYLRGPGQLDSVPALAATYARQYGSTGHSTVLLVFPALQLDVRQGFTISYHDTQFGLGPLRFVFDAKALRALPALKI